MSTNNVFSNSCNFDCSKSFSACRLIYWIFFCWKVYAKFEKYTIYVCICGASEAHWSNNEQNPSHATVLTRVLNKVAGKKLWFHAVIHVMSCRMMKFFSPSIFCFPSTPSRWLNQFCHWLYYPINVSAVSAFLSHSHSLGFFFFTLQFAGQTRTARK